MRRRAQQGFAGSLLLALLLAPAPLFAQATYSLTPFGGIDRSLPDDPTIVGLSAGVYYGRVGLRASGSGALRGAQIDEVDPVYGDETLFAYGGDVDLVLTPGRRAGAAGAFGPVDPLVFGGVGVRAERFAGAADFESHTVASFGTTISYSLFSRLRADIELRRVVPMDRVKELLDDRSIGAWEYRAGLSIRFGSGNMRPTRGVPAIRRGTRGTARAGAAGGAGAGPGPPGGRTVVNVAQGTLLHTADTYVGEPYLWGGDAPGEGFDCSGFVQYVYREHGVRLPRTSREMWLVGEPVPGGIGALRAGDLMFFAEDRDGRITHVGMYAGANMMLHSSKSGGGVGYDDLSTPRGRWFRDIYVGARRVLGVEVEGVQVAEVDAARVPGGMPGESLAGRAGGALGSGLSAFIAAAGLTDLSDLAKRLYAPDERPDGPDGAPKRRW